MIVRSLRSLDFILLLGAVANLAPGFGQAPTGSSAAPTFRVIRYMGQLDQPIGLTEGSPGVFYTESGSASPTVFTITAQGTVTYLASIPSGQNIDGDLVSASNGRFYDALAPGDTVFSVGPTPGMKSYAITTIVPFLTQNLPDGGLLGTGGSNAAVSYLVTCSLNGVVTPFYTFPAGETLPNNVILASDGNYYGIYYLQDASGYVYRVTPSGVLTNLYGFPAGTFNFGPRWSPLLQAADGNLYGVTANGGANNTGTIYKLSLGGQYTLLYTFPKGNTYNPSALIQASDGNLYGATTGTVGGSQLFRITTSGQYTLLKQMVLYYDGQCQCQLIQGSDGNIYGTAQTGGVNGSGVYFALDAGLPKPAPQAMQFHPESGAVGTRVLVWGSNLLASTVSFNGVPASAITNSGANYVWATVPAGASTGPLTVTTPGGSMTTQASFTVQ